jgi:hypothetical protein
MKPFVAILIMLWAVQTVPADPYSMSIQQAKRVSNENNAEQRAINSSGSDNSAPAPATAPAPAPAASAPANPALQATLQNISNLGADIAAFTISTNAAAEPARKTSLLADLNAAAAGSKPSPEAVQKLADDLINATGGKQKLIAQQTRLGRDIHAIFNSSHLTNGQQFTIVNDVQKILIENEVPSDDASKVLDDLKVIEAATK